MKNSNLKVNIVDLFAGAGGLSEGFHRQGFNIVAYVEKDKSTCDTLTTRYLYWKLLNKKKEDIYYDYIKEKISRDRLWSNLGGFNPVIHKEISKDTLPEVISNIRSNMHQQKVDEIDVFIGGPPCQAYSLVGRARDKYGMKKDPRNLLYKHYIKLLSEFKPKLFVFENVPGILSAGKGELWKNVQRDFKKAGYNIAYSILDSSNFGVLQKRRRVILIGWKKEYNYKYPTFETKEATYLVQDLLSDLPKIKAGENDKQYASKPTEYLQKHLIRTDKDILIDHIARPLNKHDAKIYKLAIIEWNNDHKRFIYTNVPKKLQTHNNQKSFLDRFKVLAADAPYSHTVVAHISNDGHYYIHPDIEQLRSISTREAARIQSFPDNYKFEGSRTSVLRQIGNAVPPLMAEEIAKKIRLMI